MKKIVAALLMVMVFASGCTWFKKPPQDAVDQGISKFADVKKMSSSMALSGSIQGQPGEKPQKIQFTLQATTKTDSTDDKSPKIDTGFKLQASLDNNSGSGNLLIRVVNKKMFANLQSLDIAGDSGATLKTQLASLFGTWWTLPVGDQNPFGQLADQQRKLQEQFKTTKFFTNATEEGQEDVQGIPSTRYRVEVDKEALKKFLVDITKTSDQTTVTVDQEAAIADSLKDVEFSGAVWVGNDDTVHRIRGTIAVQPKDGPSSSFDVDYQAWDFGKDVALAEPESPKDFNPVMLLPLLSALTPTEPGTTTPVEQPAVKAPAAKTPAKTTTK